MTFYLLKKDYKDEFNLLIKVIKILIDKKRGLLKFDPIIISLFYSLPYFENISIDCENGIEFRYNILSVISTSNFDTIFEIGDILYIFRYVRNFRFDTHVLTSQ